MLSALLKQWVRRNLKFQDTLPWWVPKNLQSQSVEANVSFQIHLQII